MNISLLKDLAKKSAKNAGPRYTPANDPEAPNLTIDDLNSYLASITVDETFKSKLHNESEEIQKKWGHAKNSIVDNNISDAINGISNALTGLSKSPPSRGKVFIKRCKDNIEAAREIANEQRHKDEALLEEIRNAHKADNSNLNRHSDNAHSIESRVNSIRELIYQLNSCENFLESMHVDLRLSNTAILLGAWGTGKTHFLCDYALSQTAHSKPCAIILAKDISPASDILETIASLLESQSILSAIEELNNLGKKSNRRALLIIDGINEGDNKAWKLAAKELTNLIKKFPYTGLVISCRTPMQELILTAQTQRKLTIIEHPGFTEMEFDAQTEFFRYYGLPLPEVPLLAEEFSKPLTLKIICQTLSSLSKKKQQRGFDGIASGQKGMTFILEHYILERTKGIEDEYSLPRKFFWRLIKGDDSIHDPELSGLASYLAEHGRQEIPKKAAIKILLARKEISTEKQANSILTRLEQEGLIYQHQQWQNDKRPILVIGLPYQRFSDHIVARHLLDKYLSKTSIEEIKKSFSSENPLSKIFNNRNFSRYRNPDLAEAIIMEFPERVKKILPDKNRELFFYLPETSQDLSAYKEPFIRGLNWRAVSSICHDTDRIVGTYLNPKNKYVYREMFDALVTAAAKPKHCYSGERIFNFLKKDSIRDRDRSWTEFVRQSAEGSAIERILGFYTGFDLSKVTYETAKQAVPLISTFLCVSRKPLRDKSTYALVLIGEQHPNALFDFLENALEFNDPYVSERVIAAIYGVSMSLAWYKASPLKSHLSKATKFIIREVFSAEGRFRTSHALVQSYCLGIVEISVASGAVQLTTYEKELIKPPFSGISFSFPHPRSIRATSINVVDGALGMDFSNYTLGRLVKNRNNYDDTHPNYIKIKKQIKWRIKNLGYTDEIFKENDNSIARYSGYGRTNNDGDKTERYGKKYSLIAYFEMYGWLHAHQLIDREQRPSDCDIDPSFPMPTKSTTPPLYDSVFKINHRKDHLKWLKNGPNPDYEKIYRHTELGEWILLNGSIAEINTPSQHEIWTHIQAFIIKKEDKSAFKKGFMRPGFPDNDLTSIGQNHYTFSGEIGWSHHHSEGDHGSESVYAFAERKRTRVSSPLHLAWNAFDVNFLLRYLRARTDQSRKVALRKLRLHLDDINSAFPDEEQLDINYVTSKEVMLDLERGYRFDWNWDYINGIDVEIPSWGFEWESYHSSLNQTNFVTLPPKMCQKLSLRARSRSIELYDIDDQLATRVIDTKTSWRNGAKLLYIRKDLLEKYLEDEDKILVIASWGERQVDSDIAHNIWNIVRSDAELKYEDTIFKRLRFFD